MPLRRKTYRRRPIRRRRLRLKRMPRLGQRSKSIKSLITHRYKRSTILYGQSGTIASMLQTNTGIGGGYASIGFNTYLSQIPQYTEFTTLYDYYKINYVVIKVTWISTTLSSIETAVNGTGAPILYYMIDRDDVAAFPSNAAGLQDMRANTRTKRFCFTPDRRQCTIKFKPNTLSTQYLTGVSNAYAIDYNKWIDCSNDIPYYGVKMMAHTPSQTDNPAYANCFEIEAWYYMSFKQPR